MEETGLKAPHAADPVLGARLDEPGLQGAKGEGELPLALGVTDGPLQKINGVHILDDGSFLDILLESNEGGRLLRRPFELALGAYLDHLRARQSSVTW